MSNKVFTPDFANMCVIEKAEKVKPVIDDYYLSGDYATDLDVYEQHIASLRTIEAPWLDKSKHDRELVEGVDFRVDKCQRCDGNGYTAEHDIMCDGNCHSCPVQVECENCHATGYTTVPLSPAEPPAEKVWPLLGYAPGNYSNHCANCGKEMSNVDKLCFQCLECAVKCANRIIASVPPAGEGKGEEDEFKVWGEIISECRAYDGTPQMFSKLCIRLNDKFRNRFTPSAPVYPAGFVADVSMGKPLTECMAGRDTECNHPMCPVTDEDCKNGKYCTLPLYDWRK